jgi:hypothetical protein
VLHNGQRIVKTATDVTSAIYCPRDLAICVLEIANKCPLNGTRCTVVVMAAPRVGAIIGPLDRSTGFVVGR